MPTFHTSNQTVSVTGDSTVVRTVASGTTVKYTGTCVLNGSQIHSPMSLLRAWNALAREYAQDVSRTGDEHDGQRANQLARGRLGSLEMGLYALEFSLDPVQALDFLRALVRGAHTARRAANLADPLDKLLADTVLEHADRLIAELSRTASVTWLADA